MKRKYVKLPRVPRNPLRDPRKYGRLVRKLPFEKYKPWEISKHLRWPANFTIDWDYKKREVSVWSIYPNAVKEAIKKSLK